MDFSPIDILKFNLQEKQFPYFDNDDLQLLLDKNNGDLQASSYEGCLLKAQNDNLKLSEIELPDNENYWLRLAKQFKTKTQYITGMKRADGQ